MKDRLGCPDRHGAEAGTAPQANFLVDQATNRLVGSGFSYDANGNECARLGEVDLRRREPAGGKPA